MLIDEAVIKSNGLNYFTYSSIDKERNKIILMMAYISRNSLTSRSFVKETLTLCDKIPKFIVDKSLGLKVLRIAYESRVRV